MRAVWTVLVLVTAVLAGCTTPDYHVLRPAEIKRQVDAGDDVSLPLGPTPILVRLRLPDEPQPTCSVQHENGTVEDCPPHPSVVYSGHVVSDTSLSVTALLDGSQVRAMVHRDEGSWAIEPCGELRADGTRRHMAYEGGYRLIHFCG